MASKDQILNRFGYLFLCGLAVSLITAVAGAAAYLVGHYTVIHRFDFRLAEQGVILVGIAVAHIVIWLCLLFELRRVSGSALPDINVPAPRYLHVTGLLLVALLISVVAATSFNHALVTSQENEKLAVAFIEQLHYHRDKALQADTPQAAALLWKVPSWTPPPEPLGEIYRIEREDVIRTIIAHLRTKTGEDLGPDPKAWKDKYAPAPAPRLPARSTAGKAMVRE
jgi:hypothetical protein